MTGRKALGTIVAAVCLALALDAAVTLLPENSHLRWRQLDGTIYGGLRWTFERIHFDLRPVDIAIVGPSRTQLGLGAKMIEDRLQAKGQPVNVANFSLEAAGRNLHWTIVDELYKTKAPKIIVIGVDAEPYPYGHPAFKYVASTAAVVRPPEPFLHNYFYDLAYLPSRKVKTFLAQLFQDATGLEGRFDPEVYRNARTDFTSSFTAEGRFVDMDREVPRETLLAQTPPPSKPSRVAQFLLWCCNEGDDHTYIREIARAAKAHGTKLMFVFLPAYGDPTEITDRAFLEQFGTIVDEFNLSKDSSLYENWSHLNHAGAVIASAQLANAIAEHELSADDGQAGAKTCPKQTCNPDDFVEATQLLHRAAKTPPASVTPREARSDCSGHPPLDVTHPAAEACASGATPK
jgi:hypothetical protein